MSDKTDEPTVPIEGIAGPLTTLSELLRQREQINKETQLLLSKEDWLIKKIERNKEQVAFHSDRIEWIKQNSDSNQDSLIDTTLEKDFDLHETHADELELRQSIDRIGSTDPSLREVFKLALEIAEERTKTVKKNKDDAIRNIQGRSYKGGNATRKAAREKHKQLRGAALDRWKKKPYYTPNAVAKNLIEEGITKLKVRAVTDAIKDIKPMREAAIEQWKMNQPHSVNEVSKYLIKEGITNLEVVEVAEIIKDLKPSK